MFITNKGNVGEQPAKAASMSERLREIIPVTETLSILSGYFYFNGVPPLMGPIAENKDLTLRILVGLDVDRMGYELAHAGDGDSAQEKFLNSLKNFAQSKMSDSEKCALSMETFLKMLDEGRLQIKKTKEPNHAKLYIFEMKKEVAKATDPIRWITGSSNLTYPGLNSQNEFNIELSNFGAKEAKEYFDNLWNDAEEITDFVGMSAKIKKVLKDEGVHAEVTPYEAYALVLKNYLDHRSLVDETPKIDLAFAIPQDPFTHKPKYRPLSFQKDAVNQAISILNEYNGVIIADVVGLGKSVIGSVLGRVMDVHRGIVIAPPGLVGDEVQGTGWCGYIEDFALLGWKAMSRGKMDEIEAYVKGHPDIDVVLVDEAHYFRNEDSIDYDYLWRICQGKKVVLMTATPFSNRPDDMYALLKLFTVPKKSKLVPDGDLYAKFSDLQADYVDCDYILKNVDRADKEKSIRSRLKRLNLDWSDDLPLNAKSIRKTVQGKLAGIAAEIRMIMEPVMIRRNRIDLKKDPQYKAEIGKDLPTVHPPEEQFYQLTKAQSEFYGRVIEEYFGQDSKFNGAIYRPGQYATADLADEDEDRVLLNNQQENMYKFIRRLLVHRFESSFGAFAKTVDNLITIHDKVKALALKPPFGKGVIILDRNMMDKFYKTETIDDDEFEAMLAAYEAEIAVETDSKQVYRVAEDFTEKGYQAFMDAVDSDIALFKKVKGEIKKLKLIENDPKAQQLIGIIKKVFSGKAGFVHHVGEPKRKVLVFSEFADTVDHLSKYLKEAFPDGVCVVKGLSKETDREVRLNFDGTIEKSAQHDSFDIMVATDKMSEGFNLNRAGLVINYDIPWNPTRVIQRLGRINRIGKKVFGDLYLYNYFPTDQGAEHYNIRTIAKTKVLMIHKAIGEDARIFDEDESLEASGMFEKLSANPEDSAEITFLTQCKIDWEEIVKTHPEVVEKISKLPNRVKTASTGVEAGTHLFTRKGLTLFASFMGAGDKEPSYLLMKEALEYIKCPFEQPRLERFSEGFWERYGALTRGTGVQEVKKVEGATSLPKKVMPILVEAKQNGIQSDFVQYLMGNLQHLGTLPDHVLHDIIKAKKNGWTALDAYLSSLKDGMGNDYASLLLPGEDDDVVIVAIDKQVDG